MKLSFHDEPIQSVTILDRTVEDFVTSRWKLDKTCYKMETNSGEIRSLHDQKTRGHKTQHKSEPSAVKLSCPDHLSDCTISRT